MTSSTLTCASCHDPLVMSVWPDSDSEDHDHDHQPGPSSSSSAHPAPKETTVPDDLHLPCGCHYHWQCLLDQSTSVTATLSCPNCGTTLTPNPQSGIQAVYSSEGGTAVPVNDLLPILLEEAHLSAHPEEIPAHDLHAIIAAEDDAEDDDTWRIIGLLRDVESEGERAALVAYRDPLAGGRNALHVAVEHGKRNIFWLLLWVGSDLPTEMFTPGMIKTMGGGGLERGTGVEDLRFMKDAEGRTPGDYAAASGEWDELINGGVFMLRS